MSVEFVKAARVTEVRERVGKHIRIGDEEIALFKIDGAFYAVDNVCAHQHISALHQGELDGLRVTCPMHGWTYSLETGKSETGNGRVRKYKVKVEGGFVWIEKPVPSL